MPSRFALWTGAILIVGIALLAMSYCGYEKLQSLDDLPSIEALIAEDFPDVPHLSPAALAERMRSPGTDLLIIDCRQPHEYAVSHLPGAINLTSRAEVLRHLEASGRTPDEIAVYCSVGYRSSRLARALRKEGLEPVANLRGSIFAWANQDRPLEKPDGSRADTVHPYNTYWAKLLKPGKSSIDPPGE